MERPPAITMSRRSRWRAAIAIRSESIGPSWRPPAEPPWPTESTIERLADAAQPGYSARMKILVTGATGFVMSALTRHLAERGHHVVAADLKPPSEALRAHLSGLDGPVEFREVDVTDRTATTALID